MCWYSFGSSISGGHYSFSMIKERKQIPKLFINLNFDDIVQLKFIDHDLVPMSTSKKTTLAVNRQLLFEMYL